MKNTVKCLCGKDLTSRGFNGHKAYCKKAGGKSLYEYMSEENVQKFLSRRITRNKCLKADCNNLVNHSGEKFCSLTCSSIFNNGLRKKKLEFLCLICQKPCSKTCCNQEHEWKYKVKIWLAGENNLSASQARRALIQLRGARCERCGWNQIHPITGGVLTQLHHKTGDKKKNGRNDIEILCPNCHVLTENWGNIKSGCREAGIPLALGASQRQFKSDHPDQTQ